MFLLYKDRPDATKDLGLRRWLTLSEVQSHGHLQICKPDMNLLAGRD